MTAGVLEGKTLAKEIESEVSEEVRQLGLEGVTPCLTVVLVGDDAASATYVASKGKACKRLGVVSRAIRLPAAASQDQLVSVLADLNRDPAVHGILVQLPLPRHIDTSAILGAISPAKDVDGFTPENMGRLLLGFPYTVPCTPAGVLALLDHARIAVEGLDVVIVGRSNVVGKPLAAMLMQKAPKRNCTVTVCHSATRNVGLFTARADLVVAAVGSPRFLKADMVKPGAIVVDVGINRVEEPSAEKGYRLVGDVDFGPISEKAAYITPVPGGVGPLTVAMLLKNTVKVARCLACAP